MKSHYHVTYLPLGSAGWGGAERSLLDLAGRTALTGKRVLLLVEQALKDSPLLEEAKIRNLDVQWVDWAPEHSLRHNVRASLAVFRNLDAKVIHFNISWRRGMMLVPLMARLLSRSKLIGSMRAMPPPNFLTPRKRYFWGLIPGLQLWAIPDRIRAMVWAKTLHLTVSVNRDDFPVRLINEYGFRSNTLRVIYNGVEIPDRLPGEFEKRKIRHDYGFSSDDFVVCYFGRISSEKGVQYLVEAMPGMPAYVRLLIIGEGPDERTLRELSDQLGISDRVMYVGFLSDPESVVVACNVVVVPSVWNEAFGRTVVEALAHEIPVIASRVGGMAELFIDGEHGLYVPPADSNALRNAINHLAENPEVALKMGVKGRKWVQDRYSMDRVASEYNVLYDDMTNNTPSA